MARTLLMAPAHIAISFSKAGKGMQEIVQSIFVIRPLTYTLHLVDRSRGYRKYGHKVETYIRYLLGHSISSIHGSNTTAFRNHNSS
ncbi:hypothetical protein EV356DRAFT_330226 [Viridothelium virens]|uniref:Uncharacterized protein n=1 Tax=Viridothelium virens TaxID=1048519 RepID=A0A6A6GYK4_VIRVR|nr:hypothetical protein EV356DRAFT_330226 [Viridothelium virens]